jgi:hypothetical protein
MLKLGIRTNRKQAGKAKRKQTLLARMEKAVNRVCGEYPKKNRWKIRKALSPCLFIVETQKGGGMKKSIFNIKNAS